ncbi:ankyrin repeat domain-containing protein [Thalassotalea sp. G20_0]|uniref:ankyrin repeat domain-containing protein n=1 Tax=Thalassotalea sp. G20_0 TaxID=2821093 RepID=UPI001ADD2BB9|nr:ankyrin repeat domain-containing protein [Thalassotalea sp. G20_0]MBO9496785.1 ankyrin repeat domain-containing protein [Thalassotalea sp. G20_0]
MNILKIFTPRPVSRGYQQLPHEDVCNASTEPKTSSSSVSLAPFAHRTHSSSIDPSQGLTCQTPVGNRAIEPETEPLWPNKSVTKAGTKAHGQTGKKTKADIKQATKDLHNALTFTKNLEELTNDDILALIERGAKINAKTKNYGEETALHIAALRGSKRIIELLVNKGADVNAKTSYGWTAIRCAYKNGPITPLIRCMVNAGLKIDAMCDSSTMLAHAAREGCWELVEFLLDKGAKVNTEINIKGTALHLAVLQGRPDIIKMLMNHGANINVRNHHKGKSVLHFAARLGRPEIIEQLIDHGADISARDNKGKTVLHDAARQDQPDIIEQLRNYGADINARDNKGRMLLHLVAASGQQAILDKLLQLNVDVNARDNNGQTPLYLLTCTNGQLDTIKYFMSALIKKQADINHQDSDGRTPLNFLVKSLSNQKAIKHVIDTLVLHGADVNASDSRGLTPLHFAAAHSKLDVFNHLLVKGANMSVRTNTGLMVLDVARSNGQNTAKMLESLHNAKFDVHAPCTSEGATMLVCAVQNRQWKLVDALISDGADIDAWKHEATRITSLHDAALKDRKDTVSELLKRNANPGLPSIRGLSAIHYAVMDRGFADLPTSENLAHRQSILIELIESKKVDINARDERGITALHIAASQGYLEMIRELLKRGADFNILDEDNMTAYDYCNRMVSRSRRERVCLLMSEYKADVRGVDLRKAEAADQKHTAIGLAHKVRDFFKSERNR